jgi:hypothetical protein
MPILTFPNHWLYDQVQAVDKDHDPQFTLPSTLNWIRSLRFEIDAEHGTDPQTIFDSCRTWFRRSFNPGSAGGNTGTVYSSLFRSATNAISLMSLASLCSSAGGVPLVYPGAVIWWYYAYYGAVQAMLSTHGQGRGPDSHRATMNVFGATLRTRLPHPLNMVATWQQDELYNCTLPCFPNARSTSLIDTFTSDRQQSQGMLLGYLSGTVRREVEEAKQDIKRKSHLPDFRSKAARQERNKRLSNSLSQINFMHCAFRYRGKANYRDAIYIAYGHHGIHDDSFLDDLMVTAKYSFLCALAYTDRIMGSRKTRKFLSDLDRNARGLENAPAEARSWPNMTV